MNQKPRLYHLRVEAETYLANPMMLLEWTRETGVRLRDFGFEMTHSGQRIALVFNHSATDDEIAGIREDILALDLMGCHNMDVEETIDGEARTLVQPLSF